MMNIDMSKPENLQTKYFNITCSTNFSHNIFFQMRDKGSVFFFLEFFEITVSEWYFFIHLFHQNHHYILVFQFEVCDLPSEMKNETIWFLTNARHDPKLVDLKVGNMIHELRLMNIELLLFVNNFLRYVIFRALH